MTNNSLSEDIYAVGQLMADNLNTVGVSDADVDDGLTTLAGKILNANPTKVSTVLTLNTPLVVYTDQFNVTGVLTDNEDNPIEGATIQLIWDDGAEHIATGVTNSSGVFSFTSIDPASVSSYSFQLFFAGDSDYNASNSSVVNVDTAKETSVLVVTSPASGSSVSTDSVTVSGTLKDNDGTAMSGKSVSFNLNSSSAGTATVGSDGSFTKTITGLAAGSNSITASFAATTTHTAANQSITVNRSTFDSLADLELIDGSQILSYADEQQDPYSQYATLETQLMNGDSPAAISGVTVQFWDFTDESSPLYLGEGDTDSTGKASFTYYSLGVGDVPVKAKVGSFLTKTFVVHDYFKYIASGSQVCSSTFTQFDIADINSLTGDYEISVTMKSNATKGFGIALNNATATDNNNLFRVGFGGSNYLAVLRMGNGSIAEQYDESTTYTANTDVVLKLQRVNGVYTGYVDSFSHSYSNAPSNPRYLQLESWSTAKTLTYTDFIVKPL